MKDFGSFLTEAEDKNQPKRVSDDMVTVFGRHNPPHRGHGLTLNRASNLASSIGDKAPADQQFYTSRSQDPKKNPLPFELKLQHLRKMFPEHAEKWDDDGNVRTVLNAATKAHQKGYKNFHFVGGEDRKQGMDDWQSKLDKMMNGDSPHLFEQDSPAVLKGIGGEWGRQIMKSAAARKFLSQGEIDEFYKQIKDPENWKEPMGEEHLTDNYGDDILEE